MKKFLVILCLFISSLLFIGCNFGTNTNEAEQTVTDSVETLQEVFEEDTLVQCVAITKSGFQCTRLVNSPDTLCFQHKKMQLEN